jgi:hypothetical protein
VVIQCGQFIHFIIFHGKKVTDDSRYSGLQYWPWKYVALTMEKDAVIFSCLVVIVGVIHVGVFYELMVSVLGLFCHVAHFANFVRN